MIKLECKMRKNTSEVIFDTPDDLAYLHRECCLEGQQFLTSDLFFFAKNANVNHQPFKALKVIIAPDAIAILAIPLPGQPLTLTCLQHQPGNILHRAARRMNARDPLRIPQAQAPRGDGDLKPGMKQVAMGLGGIDLRPNHRCRRRKNGCEEQRPQPSPQVNAEPWRVHAPESDGRRDRIQDRRDRRAALLRNRSWKRLELNGIKSEARNPKQIQNPRSPKMV